MKLSDKKIKEITDELDSGLACYIHKDTYETVSIPNPLGEFEDFEGWEEQREELAKNGNSYLELFPLNSGQSYSIMEDFAEAVQNEQMKDKLLNSMRGRGAFRRFREILEDSGDLIEEWYTYKTRRYGEWVSRAIKFSGEEE